MSQITPPRDRRFQFSLGALLLGITALATIGGVGRIIGPYCSVVAVLIVLGVLFKITFGIAFERRLKSTSLLRDLNRDLRIWMKRRYDDDERDGEE